MKMTILKDMFSVESLGALNWSRCVVIRVDAVHSGHSLYRAEVLGTAPGSVGTVVFVIGKQERAF